MGLLSASPSERMKSALTRIDQIMCHLKRPVIAALEAAIRRGVVPRERKPHRLLGSEKPLILGITPVAELEPNPIIKSLTDRVAQLL